MTNDYISRADALAVAQYSKDPVDGILNLPGVFGWIPVTERLPEKTGKYLVYVQHRGIEPLSVDAQWFFDVMWFHKSYKSIDLPKRWDYWIRYDPEWGDINMNDAVTHWMPIPNEPKEESK